MTQNEITTLWQTVDAYFGPHFKVTAQFKSDFAAYAQAILDADDGPRQAAIGKHDLREIAAKQLVDKQLDIAADHARKFEAQRAEAAKLADQATHKKP
ncbi:hypothetical protein JCM31185_16670 [Furfurilactobacillus curtus]|uniref:Uncharacterized protein n=2 Tax=Furfurilactobacillus curtus TaxID=1746200 RepID=A0ABQ5JPY2_9LACO